MNTLAKGWACLLLMLLCCCGCTSSETQHASGVTGNEPIIGGPCEGCEAVFQGLPDEIESTARIAPREEPGQPLRIQGRVLHRDGSPAAGTIVYAYHTNQDGIYPPNRDFDGQFAYRHGTLRGWAQADENGNYQFDTIRPASYPDSEVPQHVHMHLIEPGVCTYYIDSIVFTDDPLLTPEERVEAENGRGGSGLVTPQRTEDGIDRVVRDIILRHGIPDN